MSSKSDNGAFWMSVLLIAGTTIGAGILALPIQTGLAGIVPSVVCMIIAWITMLLVGFIIAERYLVSGDYSKDFLSLYKENLGKHSQWIVIPSYLLLFYGLIVAYLSASATILSSVVDLPLPKWLFLLIFFIPSTLVVLFGLKLINRANAALMLILGVSFVLMLVPTATNMEFKRFTFIDWHFLPSAMPVILCAFMYHVIIPTICRHLKGDSKQVKKALIVGTSLPLILNFLWIIAVIGALPLDNSGEASLLYAFNHNEPATIPLARYLKSDFITTSGLLFSIAAIFTSYIAVGEGLRHFFAELLSGLRGKSHRWIIAAITFIPPLVVALVYPDLFLIALNLVGGGSIVVLFGLMPALMGIRFSGSGEKKRSAANRIIPWILLILFSAFLLLELAQESGLLKIKPDVEHWNYSE